MNRIRLEGQDRLPSKVVCIGRNYVAHIHELGNVMPTEPVIFCKPNSAIGQHLLAKHRDETLHYETELCFCVEKGRLVGVGVGLDLTKRDTQTRLKEARLPWERAKAFDGAVVFSEFVAIEVSMVDQLQLKLWVNGELRQSGGVEQMLYKPQAIIDHVSQFMSLADGDVVMTGTPEGVGPIYSGDRFKAQVRVAEDCLVEAEWVAE